jgi:hypothetical protein
MTLDSQMSQKRSTKIFSKNLIALAAFLRVKNLKNQLKSKFSMVS